MNFLIKFLHNIGLCWKKDIRQNINVCSYKTTNEIETLKEHRDFLLRLQEKEEERLDTIENKTSQLIGQIGIIFSLISLIAPILIEKIVTVDFWLKLCILIDLAFALLFYLLSIIHAIENYNIKNFNYRYPSFKNVIVFKDKDLKEFLEEEINDLLQGSLNNPEVNNLKANNLLRSYATFRTANIFTGVLVILLCFLMLVCVPTKNSISIESPIKVAGLENSFHHIDSSINTLIEDFKKRDSSVKEKMQK